METIDDSCPDVMQVCRNGHVITDLLHSHPGRGLSHCDRCGATTLDRCPTCGKELVGANYVPGLVTMGTRLPPQRCAYCGAAFPWAGQPANDQPVDAVAGLVNLLRRLPLMIRQLRTRHGDRPPFRVQDEHDLDDLLRAVLPLQFDEVRTESRTPGYAAGNRTDFRLGGDAAPHHVAVTAKLVSRGCRAEQLEEQWREDLAYYQRVSGCRILVGFLYDAEGQLREPQKLEAIWSQLGERLELRCVIAS
jgi:hypothetical protein